MHTFLQPHTGDTFSFSFDMLVKERRLKDGSRVLYLEDEESRGDSDPGDEIWKLPAQGK